MDRTDKSFTKIELARLEAKEKTTAQKLLDILICLLPIVCGCIAIAEYLVVPDNMENPKPFTYFAAIICFMVLYLVYFAVAAVRKLKGNEFSLEHVRYKAPLYSVLFLLLALYDYLTLKTGILTQPFIPCMNSILNIAWEDRAYLFTSTLYTLRLLFLGYFIGVALGLVTGIACGYSRKVRYWIDPIINFLGPIPTSTWIPIIMVIAASLFRGAVFIIALGAWFAVTVASMTGISNVDKDYFDAARTLGTSNTQLVFRVAIPYAMPSIFQGCTQGMSSACTAIIIAEMMGVKAGLGWYITWAKSWSSYDKMYAALFIICIIFTIVTKLLYLVKKRVLRWQEGAIK